MGTRIAQGPCGDCQLGAFCVGARLGLTGANDEERWPQKLKFPAGTVIASAGEASDEVLVLREGWVCRFDMFPDGRRQIVDILLPADFVACEDALRDDRSLAVIALSDVEVCAFNSDAFQEAAFRNEENRRIVFDYCLDYSARLRSLISTLGRQAARARIAKCVVSLHERLMRVNGADERGMPIHLRQRDIADFVGLTPVHANRVIRSFADDGVFTISSDRIEFQDYDRLVQISRG